MKRNIERFPSKQMYTYLSLVEGKAAEFYHNIDRRSWLVRVKMTYFHRFFLDNSWCPWWHLKFSLVLAMLDFDRMSTKCYYEELRRKEKSKLAFTLRGSILSWTWKICKRCVWLHISFFYLNFANNTERPVYFLKVLLCEKFHI